MTASPIDRALADRYSVLHELGAGGMATVYLAEDLRHRRKVAIKVLHAELSAVIGSERFLKEIELTANLQHPHILPLFDSGDVNGQLYYVMPFVEGETLRARLDREQQLPVGDAVRIAREVADALAYAHKRGVVHRDIKPENVLLQDGHALVADFGIALAVQQAGAGRLTQTGLSLGTPQYMSPEQAMGERTIDQRADIYALGAVTYEMIAGEPPFTGPTAQAIIARAMTERPRSLVGMRETLPPAVNSAVMIALAKLPADRFATASEFSDALVATNSVAHEDSVSAPSARSRGWIRWLPAATLILGALLGAALMSRRGGIGGAAGDEVPRFLSITLPDSAPLITGHSYYDELVRSFDISADGRLVAWSSERQGQSVIWQLRTDVGSSAPVPKTEGGILPTFSPDAKSLAFAVPSKGVRQVDLTSGEMTSIGEREVVEQLAWLTPDRVLASDQAGCLYSAPPSAGTLTWFPAKHCELASGGVGRGPDATTIVESISGALYLFDTRVGTRRRVRDASSTDTSGAASAVAGDSPFFIDAHTMLFTRDSTLYAVRLDPKSAQLTSRPVPLLSGIRHEAQGGGVGLAQMAYSSSGTLAWVSGGDASFSRFVLVSPKGSTVDTLPTPPVIVSSFALSADGQRLAYTSTLPGNASVLRILDRRRNVIDSTQLSVETVPMNWVDADSGLSVIAASRTSAFVSRRYFGVVRDLHSRMRLDTTGVEYQSSSADGTMRCGRFAFWMAKTPGDSTPFDHPAAWCRFSPDGRHIAWIGPTGAFVAPTTKAAATEKQRIAPAGADEPRWSADGREILYRMKNRWYAVPSEPAPNGQLAAPRLVHEGTYNQAQASWDLAPDGRLLLLAGTPPRPASHLNIITNFPRYVESKLSTAR